MFSQFRTERKFLANNKKSKATAARSIQKDTPQLFFEMAEPKGDKETDGLLESEETEETNPWSWSETNDKGELLSGCYPETDPPLTTLLYIFWAAEVVWLLDIILIVLITQARVFSTDFFLYMAGVFLLISTVLHMTNFLFLCCCKVPGRGTLSANSCDCDRPFCTSKPYTIASALLFIPNFIVFYYLAAIL